MTLPALSRTAFAAAITLTSALALSACTTTAPRGNDGIDAVLATMASGRSQVQGGELERRVAEASAYPLGSERNPVRVASPAGQRAYLSRLRCGDLSVPEYDRVGNVGFGVFGNIIDLYQVDCGEADPGMAEVHMDMYHPDHHETEAVPGFGISGGRSEGDAPAT